MGRLFNGTSDKILFSPNPSLLNKMSLSWWLYNDTNGSAERIAITGGAPITGSGGFLFEPRYTSAVASVTINNAAGGFWIDTFAQPSAATWHHYLWVMDRTGPSNAVWVDGVSQNLTTSLHNAGTYGKFPNIQWQLMHYSSSNIFWPGRMAEFAAWGIAMGAGEATELARGISPLRLSQDRLLCYLPLDGTGTADRVYGRMGDLSSLLLAITGTTPRAHPFGMRCSGRKGGQKMAITV